MKLNKAINAIAIALGLTSVAQAQNTVYITGSTAFRAQVYFGLKDMGLAAQGGATSGNNVFTFTGTVSSDFPSPSNSVPLASAGQSVTVLCAFTGSSESVNSTANHVSPIYTNYPGGVATAVTYVNGGDLGFCDVDKSVTPYANEAAVQALNEVSALDAQNGSYGLGVAVQPFTWAASAQANGKIVNITPYIINDAYINGTEALNFFTGNASDASTSVFATGRTNDSGTRISALLDAGYDIQDTVVQWVLGTNSTEPDINGVSSGDLHYENVADGGYVSGGSVAKALSSTASPGMAVAYLGFPDADGLLNGALPIFYQGENPTTVANIVTSWHGSGVGATPWNLDGVINGYYTYWSYEHLYQSPQLSGTGFTLTDFAPDLVNSLEFEIHNPTVNGGANAIQTALTEGDMNVHRVADGGDVFTGN